MKLFYFLFVILFTAYQPKPADPVDKTLALLKQSNWAELCKTLAASVELDVTGDNDIYPKDKAQEILNTFFSKNQPFTIKLIHRVDSNPDMRFAVVLLSCKSGSYRTSVALRNNNGTFQISELRIEPEKIK